VQHRAMFGDRPGLNALIVVAALCAAAPSAAMQSAEPVAQTAVKIPDPLPDPLSPEYGKLVTDLAGQMLDGVRLGYRNCMENALYAYAVANAPGGDPNALQWPSTLAGRDVIASTVIANCAAGRAKLLAELDAEVAAKAPFNGALKQYVDLARAEFDTMDSELRTNLRNVEPKPTE
jgi:hypothetical protein